MGEENQKIILASDFGYGFIASIEDLISKKKGGKSTIRLTEKSRVLPVTYLQETDEDEYIAVATNAGRLLLFPISELPTLSKGKGNKLIQIPATELKSRSTYIASICTITPSQQLKVYAGKRHLSIKFDDLTNYIGSRARRGNVLPKGFQNVKLIESIE